MNTKKPQIKDYVNSIIDVENPTQKQMQETYSYLMALEKYTIELEKTKQVNDTNTSKKECTLHNVSESLYGIVEEGTELYVFRDAEKAEQKIIDINKMYDVDLYVMKIDVIE